jgi:beta-mannanase
MDRFADMTGRLPVVISWFESWGSADALTRGAINGELLGHVAERGSIPMITWEPWNPTAGIDQPSYRLGVIAQGDFDDYVDAWAYSLASYGGPVLLRFAHEMNAPWYPWGISVNGNSASDYVAAWWHLRERFWMAGAGNVRWVWCVDATTLDEHAAAAAYPGDDGVDWLALDGYNWGTSRPNSAWRTLDEVFTFAYSEIELLSGRPMMISEIASAEEGGSKAEWIREGLTSLRTRFPRIECLCWFNEVGQNADWRVESTQESLAAFSETIVRNEWDARLAVNR